MSQLFFEQNVGGTLLKIGDFFANNLLKRSICTTLTSHNENGRGQHRKYLPYVFAEYEIMMLVGLLKSEVAVNVMIRYVYDSILKMLAKREVM